jgi:ATP:ADP antiporter, AAA family
VTSREQLQSHPELRSHRSFPSFSSVEAKPRNRLEKLLSVFADVRSGEGVTTLLLTINVFLLLGGYYLLKTARESLILTEGGAAIKSYSSALQALLLVVVVPLYGWVASKIVRVKLVTGVLLFFALHLVLFFAAGRAGAREGVVFFVWVGIFNVFVISQVWAFANDLFTESQGKRLFPFIGIGSSLGAWLGAKAAAEIVKGSDPYTLMVYGAIVLLLCAVIVFAVDRIEARRGDKAWTEAGEKPLGAADGFALVMQDGYLRWIALLMVLLNVVNSSGEFLLGNLVVEEAKAATGGGAAMKQYIGAFYGEFFGWVNLLGFILQSFFVSRIFRFMGVRGALFILPVIALMSYSILALVPLLGVVRVAKTFENATDYSIQNTARQALFLPTSREAKYKAKAAIDTFFMRFGDVLQAGIVYVGSEVMKLSTPQFAWINIGLALVWLWVVAQIAAEHRRRAF